MSENCRKKRVVLSENTTVAMIDLLQIKPLALRISRQNFMESCSTKIPIKRYYYASGLFSEVRHYQKIIRDFSY